MIRVFVCGFLLANLLIPSVHAQLNTSLSDRQIIANILQECRELYMRSVGTCACADERARNGAGCAKATKDLPDSFRPFCKTKDVSLNEVSLYRMQNQGFIDRRCAK